MNYFRLTYISINEHYSCHKCKKTYNYFINRFPKKKNDSNSCSYNSIISNNIYLNIKTYQSITQTNIYNACLYRYNIDSNIYKLLII